MNSEIIINDKDTVVMNLIHYFVTERDYNPVVVHGINDEIWLENMNSSYKIVRIVSRYIHNNEQLDFSRYRSNQIAKKLKRKTFSLKMSILSIYVDYGENVSNFNDNNSNNLSVFLKNIGDIKNNNNLLEVFPDIIEKTRYDEDGISLFLKITDDINHSNEKKNKKMERIFSNKKPIITFLIIILNLIMFVVSDMGNDINTLLSYGANYYPLVSNGEVYRLFTYMFLHAGLVHFALNMYSLYIVGQSVENFFGKNKYLLIYILSGISGGLLSIAFNDNMISVGASGAIFGLFGALLYFGYSYRGYASTMIRSKILPIVIYNLLIGFFIEGIDIMCHVGGLIAGIITAYTVGTIESRNVDKSRVFFLIVYFVSIIYLALFY